MLGNSTSSGCPPIRGRLILVIDEVGYLHYGPDAANVLFHLVNERHLAARPMILTTNKPLASWGEVLHDPDLAEAIVDRILERGRFLVMDGPSLRTRHIDHDHLPDPARISGKSRPEFPELTPTIDINRDGEVKDHNGWEFTGTAVVRSRERHCTRQGLVYIGVTP